MTVAQLDLFLLYGTVVLLLGVLAVRASVRFGLPSLLIYLAMGVAWASPGWASSSTTPSSRTRSASPRWS